MTAQKVHYYLAGYVVCGVEARGAENVKATEVAGNVTCKMCRAWIAKNVAGKAGA